MNKETVFSKELATVDAADWEQVSGGWEPGDDICPPWPRWKFDPQPVPWFRDVGLVNRALDAGSKVSLNPQPLPPKAVAS